MPHWKYNGLRNTAPSLAGYAYNSVKEFQLVFVNDAGKTLRNAYVFVDEDYKDFLQVKTVSEDDFHPVGIRMDAIGFLGDIPEGEFPIDFRLCNQVDPKIRMHKIRVFIGHDDDAANDYSTFFWYYLDLDDYLYETDESGKWIGPGGASKSDLRIGFEDNWWFYSDCEQNQTIWNNESPITRKVCARQLGNADSFETELGTKPFAEDWTPVWA